MAPLPPGSPLGVYVHVPFCTHICPYCDFNTYRGMEALIPRYVAAIEEEIDRFASRVMLTMEASPRRSEHAARASTLYFGGGTPSLLDARQVAGIVARVRERFDVDRAAEITLEANPSSVDEAYFTGLLEAGVNRLSIGVQTFDHRGLRVLGRQHEAADAHAAVQAARRAGFGNISLDLIFGWPGQTPEAWGSDLSVVLGMDHGPDHLSLYSLIVEPGTPMAEAVERGVLVPIDDDAAADLYEAAVVALAGAGWTHYEIANWARTPELRSAHNMIYWRNGEYAGFGAGAHWRIGDVRRMNHLLPRTYIDVVEQGEEPVSNTESITARIAMGETMMLGLRLLDEGVSAKEFELRHGVRLVDIFGDQLAELTAQGMIESDNRRARLTDRGAMLANDVCARFL